MTYQSKHTNILDPQEWYTRIAEDYKNYHAHLDSFYRFDIERFLPRDIKSLRILDLGAGDWRLYKYLHTVPHTEYVACDISKKILDLHPWNVTKVVCDLEDNLPFQDNHFDLITSFFVLEHIEHLQDLFHEVARILSPKGKRIIWHFLQRREFVWKKDKEIFKIKQYRYTLRDLQKYAQEAFLTLDYFPVYEKKIILGYICVCEKE